MVLPVLVYLFTLDTNTLSFTKPDLIFCLMHFSRPGILKYLAFRDQITGFQYLLSPV